MKEMEYDKKHLKRLINEYKRVFSPLDYYLECLDEKLNPRTIYLSKRSFLHRKLPKFTEFHPSIETERFGEDQRKILIQLDKYVDEINFQRETGPINIDRLKEIYTNLKTY